MIESAIDDPDIIGFQWRLSSSHPQADICDYYASIDMGLGKGIWSKETVPRHKAHPHCMCLIIPRMTKVRERGERTYAEFLQGVTPERRAQLLPKWAARAEALGQPLDRLIRPDGLGLIARDEFRQRLGDDRFKAVSALGKALTERDWGTRIFKAGKMTRRTIAEFQPFKHIPEVRKLIQDIQAGNPVEGLRLKYLKRKYPDGAPIGKPGDMDRWFEAVLLAPDAHVGMRPRSDSRYAVYSAQLGWIAIIDPNGQRVSAYEHDGSRFTPWIQLSKITRTLP